MAEIRVQPRKRSMAWLWILLALLIIAALVYFFVLAPNAMTPATPTTVGAAETLQTLAQMRQGVV